MENLEVKMMMIMMMRLLIYNYCLKMLKHKNLTNMRKMKNHLV